MRVYRSLFRLYNFALLCSVGVRILCGFISLAFANYAVYSRTMSSNS